MISIESNKAQNFYDLLTKAGCSSENETAKIIQIRKTMERLFNHLCSDEHNMNGKKLFEQMQYLFAKYSSNVQENIKNTAHSLRKFVNDIAHGKIATPQDVKSSLHNMALLIQAFSNQPIPQHFKNLDLLPQYCLTLNQNKSVFVGSNSQTNTVSSMILDDEHDFASNSMARLPIALVLDISGSMTGTKIQQLNDGVRLFYKSVSEDPIAKYSAEIAMVAFNDKVSLVSDFKPTHKYSHTDLVSSGTTCLAEGIEMALKKLNQRKQKYKDNGLEYFQPWIVLMTDGQSTENADYIKNIAQITAELVNKNKLCLIPIGIGAGANLLELKTFSPDLPPLRLDDLKFREFFKWLSSSVSRQSNSNPGEHDRPDFDKNLANWLSTKK